MLVILRDLFAKVTASGMDDQVQCPIGCAIHLDEVVAAAKGAKAALQALGVLQFPVAAKGLQIEGLLATLPNVHPGRNIMRRLVQMFKVDLRLKQANSVHAAANVHAHNVGHGLVMNGHRRSDGTALTGMHVGHDPDLAALGEGIVAHSADLLNGSVLDDIGIGNGSCDLSLDLHVTPPKLIMKKSTRRALTGGLWVQIR